MPKLSKLKKKCKPNKVLIFDFPISHFTCYRGPRVRKLRCHIDAPLAAGRNRPLPVQCLRTLLQDERPESTAHQAEAKTG